MKLIPIDQLTQDNFSKGVLWQGIGVLLGIASTHHTEGGDMQDVAIAYLEDIGIAVYAEDMEKKAWMLAMDEKRWARRKVILDKKERDRKWAEEHPITREK